MLTPTENRARFGRKREAELQWDKSRAHLPTVKIAAAVSQGNGQRDKFGDQLPNGGAHRFCITWETSDRAPVNESTETSLSLIHVFSVSLGPANYGFKIPSTYERALEDSPIGKLLVTLNLRDPHRSNQW